MVGGLRIKLARWGFNKQNFFVLSVMERRAARNTGTRKEDVGWWDPNPGPDGNMHMGLKLDRIKYWLSSGAQPTEKVAELLGYAGVLPRPPQPPSHKPRDPKNDTKWRPDLVSK